MPDPGAIVAALPRSRLHLQFLLDNDAAPDLVLCRDEALVPTLEASFPGKVLYLGRETLPGRSLSGLLAARRANRAYYRGIADRLAGLTIERLILFLEGEPLERFLVGLPQVRSVELWEDGLSHYADLTNAVWYAARGAVQWAIGFHASGILHRRIDRNRITLRDRFEHHNLVLHAPASSQAHRAELLFLGSPLVEDRILPRGRFLAGMRAIVAASPIPVRYLPHPREDLARLAEDLRDLPGILSEDNPQGLIEHTTRYGYQAYAAAISTGLLDLGRYERSIFVPHFFGLGRMARVLSTWQANPVTVAATPADLARTIRSAG